MACHLADGCEDDCTVGLPRPGCAPQGAYVLADGCADDLSVSLQGMGCAPPGAHLLAGGGEDDPQSACNALAAYRKACACSAVGAPSKPPAGLGCVLKA
jgi:hypothetical protein